MQSRFRRVRQRFEGAAGLYRCDRAQSMRSEGTRSAEPDAGTRSADRGCMRRERGFAAPVTRSALFTPEFRFTSARLPFRPMRVSFAWCADFVRCVFSAAPLTRSAPCAPDFTGRILPSVFLSLSAFTALPRDVRYHFFRRLSGLFRFAPFFFEEPFLDVASFERAV